MTILFALLCMLIGLTLVFAGLRLARIIIPLWGFLAGLTMGGAVVAAMDNSPLLGSVLGVTVGLVAGIALAALAYLYYIAAVVIACGMLGYWLGSGFIQLFGFDADFLSAVTGLVLGLLAAFLSLTANAPKYVLIVLTATTGSVVSMGGILLMFNVISLDYFSYAASYAAISNSFFLALATAALATVGVVWQTRSSRDYNFIKWVVGGDSDNNLAPNTQF